MIPAKLTCPHARYDAGMHIQCKKANKGPCAHQRWCMSKGWAVLTDQAGNCPVRKEEKTDDPGRKDKTAPKRRDKV